MIPENITKEHIEKAIQEIDKEGIRKGRHSSTYDLVFNGKNYPPKLVISIANKFANGEELEYDTFYGGPNKPAFILLEKEGFHIVKKELGLQNLVKLLLEEDLTRKQFNIICVAYILKSNNSISTKSAIESVKKIRVSIEWNLESDSIGGRISQDCQYFPNKTFNSINEFAKAVRDGSIISIYKSKILKYPNKETSINEVIQLLRKYVLEEKGLNKIPFNCWVFQGNPKVFDFEIALKKEILTDWTVSAHKDKIKKGDKVILWITGNKSGCYALAEVTSEPHKKTSSPDDHLWKGSDKSELKADIKITHNLVDTPILKEQVDSLEKLKNLKAGNQGTNFSATEEEYNTLLSLTKNANDKRYWLYAAGENASKWDEFYNAQIIALGWDELGDLREYETRNEIRDALRNAYGGKGSKKNDVSANDDFVNKVNIGDIIIVKKGRGELLGYGVITSDYFFDDKRNDYKSCRKIDWKLKGSWKLDFSLVLKTFTDITKYSSDHPDYDTYYERLLGIMENKNNSKETEKMNLSLNTILYGPPGTGKTFKLKNEFFEKFTDERSTQTKEEFLLELVDNLSWWETLGIALLDLKRAKVNEILEHPFIKAKVSLSNSKSIRATLWGQMQVHTIEDCEYVNVKDRRAPYIFNKSQNSHWEIVESNVENDTPELLDILSKYKNFKPSVKTRKRYVFTTFHQSFSYEDFIEGIKPIVYEDEQNPENGKQVIYDIKPGLFKQIVKEAKADRDNNYAIFIDEINRGNIANIFGELITLIEDDKRIDTANYIPAKLPYSNEDFGVPPNLYIIGTMNTADRSVEALDTALRRRFSFIEMNPEPEKLSSDEFKCDEIDLEALLTAINGRIEKLLDKDYCIGILIS